MIIIKDIHAHIHRARTIAHHRRTHRLAVKATVFAELAHLVSMVLPVVTAIEGVIIASVALCAIVCAISEET